MTSQTGIAIGIKAFLPTGKSVEEQFAALSLVMKAHETGDYSELLAKAKVEQVQTEPKTRRIEDAPAEPATEAEPADAQPAVANGLDGITPHTPALKAQAEKAKLNSAA